MFLTSFQQILGFRDGLFSAKPHGPDFYYMHTEMLGLVEQVEGVA